MEGAFNSIASFSIHCILEVIKGKNLRVERSVRIRKRVINYSTGKRI